MRTLHLTKYFWCLHIQDSISHMISRLHLMTQWKLLCLLVTWLDCTARDHKPMWAAMKQAHTTSTHWVHTRAHIRKFYSLEYLVDSWFWHWELQEHPDESDHDKRSGSPQDGEVTEPGHNTQHFKHLQNHRHPQEEHHAGIKLAPVVLQIWYFSLRAKQSSAGTVVHHMTHT